MRYLITLRVPDYNPDKETLSTHGLETATGMTANLEALAIGRTVLLLSSDAPRALAYAAIIGEALGVKAEAHRRFFSDEDHSPKLDAGLKLVQEREDEADIIIIVSHHGFSMHFPAYFAKTKVGEEEREHVHPLSLEKGDGRGFDLKNHELTHIRAT